MSTHDLNAPVSSRAGDDHLDGKVQLRPPPGLSVVPPTYTVTVVEEDVEEGEPYYFAEETEGRGQDRDILGSSSHSTVSSDQDDAELEQLSTLQLHLTDRGLASGDRRSPAYDNIAYHAGKDATQCESPQLTVQEDARQRRKSHEEILSEERSATLRCHNRIKDIERRIRQGHRATRLGNRALWWMDTKNLAQRTNFILFGTSEPPETARDRTKLRRPTFLEERHKAIANGTPSHTLEGTVATPPTRPLSTNTSVCSPAQSPSCSLRRASIRRRRRSSSTAPPSSDSRPASRGAASQQHQRPRQQFSSQQQRQQQGEMQPCSPTSTPTLVTANRPTKSFRTRRSTNRPMPPVRGRSCFALSVGKLRDTAERREASVPARQSLERAKMLVKRTFSHDQLKLLRRATETELNAMLKARQGSNASLVAKASPLSKASSRSDVFKPSPASPSKLLTGESCRAFSDEPALYRCSLAKAESTPPKHIVQGFGRAHSAATPSRRPKRRTSSVGDTISLASNSPRSSVSRSSSSRSHHRSSSRRRRRDAMELHLETKFQALRQFEDSTAFLPLGEFLIDLKALMARLAGDTAMLVAYHQRNIESMFTQLQDSQTGLLPVARLRRRLLFLSGGDAFTAAEVNSLIEGIPRASENSLDRNGFEVLCVRALRAQIALPSKEDLAEMVSKQAPRFSASARFSQERRRSARRSRRSVRHRTSSTRSASPFTPSRSMRRSQRRHGRTPVFDGQHSHERNSNEHSVASHRASLRVPSPSLVIRRSPGSPGQDRRGSRSPLSFVVRDPAIHRTPSFVCRPSSRRLNTGGRRHKGRSRSSSQSSFSRPKTCESAASAESFDDKDAFSPQSAEKRPPRLSAAAVEEMIQLAALESTHLHGDESNEAQDGRGGHVLSSQSVSSSFEPLGDTFDHNHLSVSIGTRRESSGTPVYSMDEYSPAVSGHASRHSEFQMGRSPPQEIRQRIASPRASHQDILWEEDEDMMLGSAVSLGVVAADVKAMRTEQAPYADSDDDEDASPQYELAEPVHCDSREAEPDGFCRTDSHGVVKPVARSTCTWPTSRETSSSSNSTLGINDGMEVSPYDNVGPVKCIGVSLRQPSADSNGGRETAESHHVNQEPSTAEDVPDKETLGPRKRALSASVASVFKSPWARKNRKRLSTSEQQDDSPLEADTAATPPSSSSVSLDSARQAADRRFSLSLLAGRRRRSSGMPRSSAGTLSPPTSGYSTNTSQSSLRRISADGIEAMSATVAAYRRSSLEQERPGRRRSSVGAFWRKGHKRSASYGMEHTAVDEETGRRRSSVSVGGLFRRMRRSSGNVQRDGLGPAVLSPQTSPPESTSSSPPRGASPRRRRSSALKYVQEV